MDVLAQSILEDYDSDNAELHRIDKRTQGLIHQFTDHLISLYTLIETSHECTRERLDQRLDAHTLKLNELQRSVDKLQLANEKTLNSVDRLVDVYASVNEKLQKIEMMVNTNQQTLKATQKGITEISNENVSLLMEFEGLKQKWLPTVISNVSSILSKKSDETIEKTTAIIEESKKEYILSLECEMQTSRVCVSNEVRAFIRAVKDC